MQSLQTRLHELYDQDPAIQSELAELLKSFYDDGKQAEPRKFASRSALAQLHVKGFDSTQIWEQLKMTHDHLLMINQKRGIDWIADSLDILEPQVPETSHSTTPNQEEATDIDEDEDEDEDPELQHDNDEDDEMGLAHDDEEDIGFEQEYDDDEEDEHFDSYRDFFGDDEDEEDIDITHHQFDDFKNFFGDDEDDEDDGDEQGNDMSREDQPTEKASGFTQIDDSDHVVDHLLTPYESRQNSVKSQIEAIEQDLIGPKKWDMRGEVTAHQRETDSLVYHDLDFDLGIKLTAPITNEVALEFEEIIRNRIRDNAFDDVVPRVQLEAKPFQEKQEVSSEKPRYGLAELYEKEFMAMATGITDSEVKLQEKHRDITSLFAKINHQLDALSNYYHTAKNRTTDLTIVSTESIAGAKEDILPVMVNATQTTAAPQEVYQPEVHALTTSKTELTKDEKDAAVRRRKEQKKKHFKSEEEKTRLAAIGGDENSKKKIEQKKLEKDYKKVTKSSRVTVQGNGRNTGDTTKYTSFTQFAHKMQDNTLNKQK